jgi:hypothetical protein
MQPCCSLPGKVAIGIHPEVGTGFDNDQPLEAPGGYKPARCQWHKDCESSPKPLYMRR